MEKQEVLQGALALNGDDRKYTVSVEGDTIILQAKWMDALHFAPGTVTDEVRSFRFIVTLKEDGTYTERDALQEQQVTASRGSLSGGFSSFSGTQISFGKTISFGVDKSSGEEGVNTFTFHSEEWKKPLREYLAACGWKKVKKGFWATLFGR